MHFFFVLPTIRIRQKKCSNVDGIKYYSNNRLFVDIPSNCPSLEIMKMIEIKTILKRDRANTEIDHVTFIRSSLWKLIVALHPVEHQ
jgi:hypothetical protein